MELNSLLESNKKLFVVAVVRKRENRKAVCFEPKLVAGSYEVALVLEKQCKEEDIIIIPPFTRRENNDISPNAVAKFYRAYYG